MTVVERMRRACAKSSGWPVAACEECKECVFLRELSVFGTPQYTACSAAHGSKQRSGAGRTRADAFGAQADALTFSERMPTFSHVDRHWLQVGSAVAAVVAAVTLATAAVVRLRRPTAEQREELRRRHLAAHGRIVDGNLFETQPAEGEPRAVFYRYRIAGVTYECAQDVSALTAMVRNLRLDSPVQVRYDRGNPADSIVVAEDWNGLWEYEGRPRTV